MSKQNNHLQASNPETLGSKSIGRRQLLSTLALGSAALAGTSVFSTSIVDKLVSPALAQQTVAPLVGHQFTIDDTTGKITGYTRIESEDPVTIYWPNDTEAQGLFVDLAVPSIDRVQKNAFPGYREFSGSIFGLPIAAPLVDYPADQVAPITSPDGSFVVYPVLALTSDPEATRVFVGFYAKSRTSAAEWQYIPAQRGLPQGIALQVPVVVKNAENEPELQYRLIGSVPTIGAVAVDETRSIVDNGFLADTDQAYLASRNAFSDALTALKFGEGSEAEREYRIRRDFNFIEATTTSTEAPAISSPTTPWPTTPWPTTPWPTTPWPTTPWPTTPWPTTLGATIAATTTRNSTTMAATNTGDPALVSPTIAGELSVRGAINAQGNIGANVARSLSGRLSSFRSRNRSRR